MCLSEKLLALRKAAGLSQDSVAEELGITRQSVSRWEQGLNIPSLDNLRLLGQLYGVSLDELTSCADSSTNAPAQESSPETPAASPERWTRERKLILVLSVLLALAIAVIVYQNQSGAEDVIDMNDMVGEEVEKETNQASNFVWKEVG